MQSPMSVDAEQCGTVGVKKMCTRGMALSTVTFLSASTFNASSDRSSCSGSCSRKIHCRLCQPRSERKYAPASRGGGYLDVADEVEDLLQVDRVRLVFVLLLQRFLRTPSDGRLEDHRVRVLPREVHACCCTLCLAREFAPRTLRKGNGFATELKASRELKRCSENVYQNRKVLKRGGEKEEVL